MTNGLYRYPLTHNPRVVGLEDLYRIRYENQPPAHDVPEPAKGVAPVNAAPALQEEEPEPDNDAEPAESRRPRQTYDISQRIAILAEASAPGAKVHEVCAKYGVHQTTIWEWKRLGEQKRRTPRSSGKPAKRRRVVSERQSPERRETRIAPERPGLAKSGEPFEGIDDIAETLRQLILDANKAARGVEALRSELRRVQRIFSGK